MDTPETRLARASGSTIAYQVHGSGPVTVCAVPPMAQNIDLAWELPVLRSMLERYGSFSRQVVFDKRGTGMSDRNLDIPALDERVDELMAVMNAAEVDRAFLHGLSEGGPMAIMFAATYPERVEGLILEGTGAALTTDEQREWLKSPEGAAQSQLMNEAFVNAWGTPDSMTLSIFGPSLTDDPHAVEWWPRYERQSANRDALFDLFRMNGEMDARGVIGRVDCPVLIIHRTDDRVIPVERARETFELFEEAGADVRLVEVPGHDHFTFAGDFEVIADEIERFTTGRVRERAPRRIHDIEIATLGGFEVRVDGEPVPTSSWGSKRARTLLKRLVAARGWPVTRDELIELLWPDDTSDRLGARLSVQLSAVRRILFGAVIADRSSVRLDLSAVRSDIDEWFKLDDDAEIVAGYAGDFLPGDRYDDWSFATRDEARDRFVAAAKRLSAESTGDDAIGLLRRVTELDPYDETAHRELIRCLELQGRRGDSAAAHERYVAAMVELDVPAASVDEILGR